MSLSPDDLIAELNLAYRDFSTAGVASSGAHEPAKLDIRNTFSDYANTIRELGASGVSGGLYFGTLAALNADLVHTAGTGAIVWADPTPTNCAVYKKVGASGSGSWSKVAELIPIFNSFAVTATAQASAAAASAAAAEASAVRVEDFGTTDTVIVDADGNAVSYTDAVDQRVMLAFDGAGELARSNRFVLNIAQQASVDNTPGAINRLPPIYTVFSHPAWVGFTTYGQSNAAGSNGQPISTTQPFANTMWNGSALVPLVASGSENSVPGAANHAKDAVARSLPPWATFPQDWVTYQGGAVDVLANIKKGTAPYTAAMNAVTARKNAAVAAGKTFAERSINWVHGETDSTSATSIVSYRTDLIQFQNDFSADAMVITGQANTIPMFIAALAIGSATPSPNPAIAMLEAAETDPDIFVVCAEYALDNYGADGLHLNGHGQRQLGEYFGKALHRFYIERRNPSTVRPISWALTGPRTIEIKFFVPVPPLVIDTDLVWPNRFATGSPPYSYLGFNVYTAATGGSLVQVVDANLVSPDTIVLTTGANIALGYRVDYALTVPGGIGMGSGPRKGARGNLRDCDRTPSHALNAQGQQYPLYNWCTPFRKVL